MSTCMWRGRRTEGKRGPWPRIQRMNATSDLWTQNNEANKIFFVRSSDDGKTWSQPSKIIQDREGSVHQVSIGRDGTIYVPYTFWDLNVVKRPIGYDRDIEFALSVSHDGGETF